MVQAGAVTDYTFSLVGRQTHPNLGTVEIRSCDAQTRLDHTVALTALIQSMCKELGEHYEAGFELGTFPHELLEENKWLAARYGLGGELIDLPQHARVSGARARPGAWSSDSGRRRASWGPNASSRRCSS